MSEDRQDGKGLSIGEVDPDDFRRFAGRFATSPEIGAIRTCLDKDAPNASESADVCVTGLNGCDRLCAAACFQLYRSKTDEASLVVKLDSVMVDDRLRRRGLGAILATQSFIDFVSKVELNVTRIYAHSVHPATVRLLRRLGFNDPPVIGAPISNLSIDPQEREDIVNRWTELNRGRLDRLRLQCELCRKKHRRAIRWCEPR